MRVLILGGYGVFGLRLARGLVRNGFPVGLAGRDLVKAQAAAADLRREFPAADVMAALVDTGAVTQDGLRSLGGACGVGAVVDATGPWQSCGYGFARTVVSAGLHYLDIADARGFVSGFSAALDADAKAAGVVALTGASSTPALSTAALDEVVRGWREIRSVEIAILPGNRAPRGLAVIRAILSYAGRPTRVFVGGHWQERPGWGMTERREVPGLGRRWTSLCETPDLDIVPARYGVTRDAVFRAGLELAPLHLGVVAAGRLVRAGLVASFDPVADLLRRAADLLLGFGSDRGGMVVAARGTDGAGDPVDGAWLLTVEAGDGPYIPTLPALAAVKALSDGRIGEPGASPCAGVLDLAAIAAEFAPHAISWRLGPCPAGWCP
jgi:saccharopine dehydrogenase-like NADP-dependent oxidoreductase